MNIKRIIDILDKNKKICCIGIAIAFISAGSVAAYSLSNSKSNSNDMYEENIKSVSVRDLSEEGYTESKKYSGYVTSKESKNLAFLVGGKISGINVDTGDEVKEGQVLAKIDTSTIQLSIDSSNQNINLAKSTIDKLNTNIQSADLSLEETKNSYDSKITQLEDSFNNEKENYDRYKALYDVGAVTKAEFEGKELSYNTVKNQLESLKTTRDNQISIQQKQIESLKNDLASAEIQVEQAEIALKQSMESLNNAVLTAPCDGYVVSTPAKQGEVVNAGTPVIQMKGGNQVINIGVDSEDYKNFSVDMPVSIDSEGEKYAGTITSISSYPDEKTKTYNLEITCENQNLVLGNLVSVEISLGQSKGYFIPISAVINREGTNYIYVLSDLNEDGYYNVSRKEVTLGEVDGENVKIEDFDGNAQVIIDGVKYIKETDKVTIDE